MIANPHDDLKIRDEITVHDILVPIWAYRKYILMVMAAGMILAIIYQFTATPLYTAQITIAPLPVNLSLSQTGSSISGLSLLSSVSGSSTSSGPTDFDKFTTLLQSRLIAHNLEQNYHVKQYVFAKYWDDKKKKWTGERENFLVKFGRILFNKPWHPPTDDDLANYLTKKFTVTTVGSFTVLDYDFKDPKLAKAILGGTISEAQRVIRDQQLYRANSALTFLNKQLDTSPSSMVQQALIALAIEWEQKKLLAENNLDVGVEISEPLEVSDYPTSPSALIDLVIGIFGLGFVAVVISALLGLFVADKPEDIRDAIAARFHALVDKIRGRSGGVRLGYER